MTIKTDLLSLARTILLTGASASVVVACGGAPDDVASTGSQPTPAPTSAPTPALTSSDVEVTEVTMHADGTQEITTHMESHTARSGQAIRVESFSSYSGSSVCTREDAVKLWSADFTRILCGVNESTTASVSATIPFVPGYLISPCGFGLNPCANDSSIPTAGSLEDCFSFCSFRGACGPEVCIDEGAYGPGAPAHYIAPGSSMSRANVILIDHH